jgi:hypothetical protein
LYLFCIHNSLLFNLSLPWHIRGSLLPFVTEMNEYNKLEKSLSGLNEHYGRHGRTVNAGQSECKQSLLAGRTCASCIFISGRYRLVSAYRTTWRHVRLDDVTLMRDIKPHRNLFINNRDRASRSYFRFYRPLRICRSISPRAPHVLRRIDSHRNLTSFNRVSGIIAHCQYDVISS